MKLIEVNELLRILQNYNNKELTYIEVIDAIPVRWIKKYSEKDDAAASIYRMLEAWEEIKYDDEMNPIYRMFDTLEVKKR